MKKKSRLFALLGVLGLVALTGAVGAEGAIKAPVETFCMCACPGGTVICVGSINGDCGVACAQAMQLCPSDM
jgi:hypothetical protein